MNIFEIREITKFAASDGLTAGKVCFHHQEPFGEDDVGQSVEVEVRISTRADITIEQLHEALFEKAVEELRLAVQLAEGQTAKSLLDKSLKDEEARLASFSI
jgi:hypothetical protein